MQKTFELNQKVSVFGQSGIITDIVDETKEPHLYGVTFDDTNNTYVIEAHHIEDKREVTDRIKTLEDAIRELGNEHPFVQQYQCYNEQMHGNFDMMNDIAAFMKLRIITAALNEKWQPTYADDEYRYFPWFCLYTEDEYKRLDEDEKMRCCRVVGRSYGNAFAYGGLVYALANFASSYSGADFGSRLAFKTRELALYAGAQFVEIWCDFLF